MNQSIDFKQISNQLQQRAENILIDICPGGKRYGKEYRAGSVSGGAGKSFGYNLDEHTWADFAVSGHEGKGIIDLYMVIKGTNFKTAIKDLSETYLHNRKEQIKIEQKKEVEKKPFACKPLQNTVTPNFKHHELGDPSMVHIYKDFDGDLLFYVLRYDTEVDGKPDKELRPLSFFSNNRWQWQAWKTDRPLYGLEFLKQFPDRKILLVEGEKAADAARQFVNNYNILTWQGGVKAIHQTDWSPLKGKEVLMWPDADEPGLLAMRQIADLLLDHCQSIKVIQPDKTEGWDAADAQAEGWDHAQFIKWAKEGLTTLLDPNNKELVIKNERRKKIQQIESTYPHIIGDKGSVRPLSTLENFQHLLKAYGIIVRNNMLTKNEEFLIPDQPFNDEGKENAQLAFIKSISILHKFPIGQVEEFLKFIANQNQYNPVVTWIKSKPWDGTERLKDFYNTIKAIDEDEEPKIKWIKETLIKRWMVSAVAAVFNHNGVSAHGALVFQGRQGSGKTYWFKKLVPRDLKFAKDGVTLRTDDKDSVMQALSFWLVELGEVDATFRKSDISSLKSFITRDSDTFRMPFARRESTFARRTVFFASVNPRQFLHDETGNRRFWTIECDEIDYMHNFDMQQIWAEVYESLYLMKEPWVLQPDEKDFLDGHNEDFKALDPVEELIQERLDWEILPEFWECKTATEILIECGKKNPTKQELNYAAQVIRKLNGGVTKRTKKARYLAVPRLKTFYQKSEGF